MSRNPFKFLDSYTLSDREIFFGREAEIEEIYSRLFHGKMLLVYGPSGSGKTSLLQCGLAGRFSESNWKPLFIRCKEHVVDSLHYELEKNAVTPFKNELTVSGKLYSLYLDFLTPVFLIFDQFEELFIFGEKKEKEEFVRIVKELLSDEDINVHIILSIREEYLASLSEFEDDLPTLFDNRIRIEKMKKGQAVSVIQSPCTVCDVSLDEGLAESVLDKIMGANATIELTWLQVLMDRLYKTAEQRGERPVTIRNSDLESLGNLGDVLGNFLQEQLDVMEESKNGEIVLKALVSSEGTKRQLTIDELKEILLSLGHRLEKERILSLVQYFVTVRILSDKDENDRYELKHDNLAAAIFKRFTAYERELQEVRQMIENAFRNYKKTDSLLGEKELKYINSFEGGLLLKKELSEFLDTSKLAINNYKKIQRKVKLFSVIGFILLLALMGTWALKELRESTVKHRNRINYYKHLDFPEVSLRNACERWKYDSSFLTRKALLESFYHFWNQDSIFDKDKKPFSPYSKVIDFKPCESDIVFADYSPDGTHILGYLADSSIIVWSQLGKEIYHYKPFTKQIIQLKISENNKFITCLYSDSSACLMSVSGSVIFQEKISFDLVNCSRVMAFSKDSRFVAYSSKPNTVKIYGTDGSLFQVLDNHSGAITALDFSGNNQLLATASRDHGIRVFYFDRVSNHFKLYTKINGHRDVVWSVQFDKSSSYILSSSEDCRMAIWNLNGENIFDELFESNHLGWVVQGKFIDACFSKDEKCIMVKKSQEFMPGTGKWTWLYWNYPDISVPGNDNYNHFQFVKSLKNGIVYKNPEGVRYISHREQIYHTFREDFRSVSFNDSYLFGIVGNRLKFYPIDEKVIIRMVLVDKIFGEGILKKQFKYDEGLYDF